MSIWKRLREIVEGPRDYSPGWRTNSVWDRASEIDRKPVSSPQAPKQPRGQATGPDVWHGRSMKDNDLFQTKSDKKTGRSVEAGLIPALKEAGGTVSRAPDGSGIAVCPMGYRIDSSVWKEWSPTRSKAQMDAVTGGSSTQRNAYDLRGGKAGVRNRLPVDQSNKPAANRMYDVLVQGKAQENGGVLVTKVVWSPVDRNSIEGQSTDARQAKLDLLMDTDDPSELSKMFQAQQRTNTLGKPAPPAEMGANPLASPTKVQWTKGNAPDPMGRPSSWDDIDLNRVPKKR